MVLSAAMMCRYGLGLPRVAQRLEAAVTAALDAGYRTGDIMQPGCSQVGCRQMGEVVLQQLEKAFAKADPLEAARLEYCETVDPSAKECKVFDE